MACNNCFINCDNITSDQCVQYTGPDVPAFGICQGDQVSKVEQVLLEQLQSALIGTGITPDLVTLENCPWLKDQFIGQQPNLSALLQLLIDNECTLKEMVDAINDQLASDTINFNTLCLQGLPTEPTTNDIIQSIINTLCTLNSTVADIPNTYVKASDINNLVQQQIAIYLANSQSGTVEYFQYFPLKAILPFYGDLSSFDNTGKGLDAAGMKNMYLCNGLNGTPDLRGVTLVGAVRNVPGNAFDPAVDPSNPDNPNWALGDRAGENKHLITTTEMPNHTHTVTDLGHTHNLTFKNGIPVTIGGSTAVPSLGTNPISPITLAGAAASNTTGITLQATGGSQKHNNIQPSIAVYWIIRML